ncbi:uncharacterized protein LOC120264774 [Dioscorea cayenensis subsp. rotundata]|uniref:Uncharacterized protein LOC120264774 n=1 Tax=Dioscorea cayennensis subsp. rotundata TaxID=55577 RepID=A0AB40BMB4_DIOCR|nr:uncharacterized protein LOC120264774 [Dioscorea cayenensis subsp. rotundata]
MDKLNGIVNREDIRLAQDFLRDLQLLEPPSMGKKYTWTNGQANPIWVKLDRFLINSDWVEMFPKAIQHSLPRLRSDHVPIRLESGAHSPIPRFFRFEQAWCMAKNFGNLIRDWWDSPSLQGCSTFILAKKFSRTREHLRN